MSDRKYIFLLCFYSVLLISLAFIPSCKTKKAPYLLKKPPVEKIEQRVVVVQVCDKFQMSYDGLPCIVYFSDLSSAPYTTAVDGKISIKIPLGDVDIEKIVYDFASYVHRGGQLLASRDFKLATRIPSSPLSQTTVVEGTFSSEVKNLFVLVR